MRLVNFFKTKFPKKSAWLYEMLFVLALLICLTRIFDPETLFSTQKILNPLWIPILLIAPRYGFGPGVVVGFLAFSIQVLTDARGIPDRTYMEMAAESGRLTQPILLVSVALFLGIIRQKYFEKEQEIQEKFVQAEDSLARTQRDLNTANEIKSKLESRIVGETKTIKTLYESALKLESLDLDQIREGCLEIFRKHFDVKKASYYIVQDQHFVLAASVGWDEGRDTEAKSAIEKSVLKYAIRAGSSVSVKELIRHEDVDVLLGNEAKPYIMIPLSENLKYKDAVISIEEIDFLSLNQANINMMNILTEWTSKAIQNAILIEQARILSTYSDVEGVADFNLFHSELEKERIRAVTYRQPLSIITFKISKYGFMKTEVQDLLKRSLIGAIQNQKSDVERTYKYRFDGIYLMICPMLNQAEAEVLAEKIERKFLEFCGETDGKKPELSVGVCEFHEKMQTAEMFLQTLLAESGIR